MTWITHKNGTKERICPKTGETIILTSTKKGVIKVESKFDKPKKRFKL